MMLSKLLGYLIILGSAIVKVPQIINGYNSDAFFRQKLLATVIFVQRVSCSHVFGPADFLLRIEFGLPKGEECG